jgi:cytochrome c
MTIRRNGLVAAACGFAAMAMTGPALAQGTGDAKAGEDVFKKCRTCHDVGDAAKNKVGPLLNGIVGRKAGTVEGFNYSDANKKAGNGGLAWTEAELNAYLLDPRKHMPGNKMAFAGLKDDQDRADVIAYLKTFK